MEETSGTWEASLSTDGYYYHHYYYYYYSVSEGSNYWHASIKENIKGDVEITTIGLTTVKPIIKTFKDSGGPPHAQSEENSLDWD